MNPNNLLKSKDKSSGIISSKAFQVICVMIIFTFLLILRMTAKSFGVFSEPLHFLLIALAGYWFGLRGSLIMALMYTFIIVLEVNIFPHDSLYEIAKQTLVSRLLFFLLGGISLGHFFESERLLKEKLTRLAQYDELTGCLNFRSIMESLEMEVQRARRYQRKMVLVMFDLDSFKVINDNYGHSVGSRVLGRIGEIVRSNIRKIDIVGRYGGDEFLIILPEISSEDANIALERIREEFSHVTIESPHSKEGLTFNIKISAGIVSLPENKGDVDGLIAMADFAAYKAKKAGEGLTVVERRKWIRFKPLPGVRVEISDVSDHQAIVPLEIVNISQGGMQLIFSQNIEKEYFLCRMSFQDEKFPSEIMCKVIRKKKTDEGLWRLGVSFVDIPQSVRDKVLKYVKTELE